MRIKFEEVNHIYNANSPMQQRALIDVNFEISSGEFVAIIGHTGSGKSTLIQHMNALLKPSNGIISIGDDKIESKVKNKKLKSIRQKVGLVFQFPEYQLFEETVEKDIMFGPMNYGVSESEARQRVQDVIKMVGLDSNILSQSPFNLSGGQMRRVAIAGILAMNPEVLVLDEPTAGLDPQGQREIMDLFAHLHRYYNKTIILVTHDMNLVAQYAERVLVMHRGELKLKGTPNEVFKEKDILKECGITLPQVAQIHDHFNQRMKLKSDNLSLTTAEFVDYIEKLVGGK